jgi:hypothetical protein
VSKKIIIPYSKESSNIFNKIRRPKLAISIYSRVMKDWIRLENVLADTGADISVLPESLGILIVGKYKRGKRYDIIGLLPDNVASMHMHKLTIRLGDRLIRTDFAISNSDDIPPTLGRVNGLDKFDIRYQKGKQLIVSY